MSHILPRYTQQAIHHDPLAILIAQHETREHNARQAIHNGTHTPDEAATLRGIPCITRGITGTSPGTDPLHETIRRNTVRRP